MLFQLRWREPIEAGEVDLTFRRWRRCQVVAGRRYRTAVGMLEVDHVSAVEPDDVTDADALRAGHPDAETLLADLPGDPAMPMYRVQFHLVRGPDPRDALAADDDLADADVEAITTRLARLDKASPIGPWTTTTLELITEHPAVRAGDLAPMVGRETAPFKLDVRKLKNLGLTVSLERGYRLSPRGEAYLGRVRPAG